MLSVRLNAAFMLAVILFIWVKSSSYGFKNGEYGLISPFRPMWQNPDDEVAKVPFNGDEVRGSLGEWERSLCRDDMRKAGVLLLEF